jgi:lycopene beta-cyclase
MQHYDFIIAGGGAAGLSLAYHMLLSPLRNRSILIVDKDDEDQLQRNWGFWTTEPTLFDSAVQHSWNQLQFVSDGVDRRIPLGAYHYKLMHGAAFYRFALEQLAACPNVTFARGVVHNIQDGADVAQVAVNGDVYDGAWVFDSIVRPGELKQTLGRSHFLRMQFKGWDVQTPFAAFDPRAARLFDLRTPQQGALRFFYVMPYSECHALVEHVVFAADVLKQSEYDAALKTYIETTLGIREYQISGEENGAVPITDYPFTRRSRDGAHVMTLGAKAGRIKPSTGYSFLRVQKDAEAIVQSLLRHGHPFDVPPDPPFFKWCDSILLEMMLRQGDQLKPVFSAMFQRNPIAPLFRFLDEVATPAETLALIASLPKRPFLKSLLTLATVVRPTTR